MGALSWQIERGHAGATDLAGLRTVLACMYDDDEPGSPWKFVLYVDDRGDELQSAALSQVVAIDVDHTPGRVWFRADGHVTVRIGAPVDVETTVTCVIPGHHRSGREVHADVLSVEDGALSFGVASRCGYEADFAYSSADS